MMKEMRKDAMLRRSWDERNGGIHNYSWQEQIDQGKIGQYCFK